MEYLKKISEQEFNAGIKKIPCEIYSRVVGYYRPVSQWNNGKKSEYKDRMEYKMSEEILSANIK